jgi:hypothetical protein
VWVIGAGDVACGEHVGVGGGQVFVDDDAVVDVQPGRFGQRRVGGDAHSDHDGVGVDDAAVAQPDAGGVTVRAGDLGDLGAEAERDAVGAVQGGVDLGQLRAEYGEQR